MNNSKNSEHSSSSLGKALELLLALSAERHELGTTELANKLGMHKATASRILIKLAEYGFVFKDKESRKYWLGPAIHQIGLSMAHVSFNFVMQVARRHVDALSESIGEAVTSEIWLGDSTVPTYYALSDRFNKTIKLPGQQLALHAAAGAKAILAYTHADKVDALLEGDLAKITKNTVTDKQLIKERLLEYLHQGYSTDYEEMNLGICAVAAPVFDQLRQPVAAVVVLMPASRSQELLSNEVISQLKSTTSAISKELSARRIRRK